MKKETKYIIYTSPECGKCEAQKKQWDAEGVSYEERDVSRFKSQQDEYDREALIQANTLAFGQHVIINVSTVKKGEFKMKKPTKYIIYTSPDCPKCEAQKKQWDADGISYEERSADRIKNHEDKYDREAHVESAMQNEMLPVIIKIGDWGMPLKEDGKWGKC